MVSVEQGKDNSTPTHMLKFIPSSSETDNSAGVMEVYNAVQGDNETLTYELVGSPRN